MLNKKPDTIQGFLSPTKLLSGKYLLIFRWI